MTPVNLDPPVRVFHAAAAEIRDNVQFMQRAARLRPRLNNCLQWEMLSDELKKLNQDFMNAGLAEIPFLEGQLLRLAACFEEFLRGVIVESVSVLNVGAGRLDAVDGKMVMRNRYWCGRALARIYTPLEHLTFDYGALCTEVGTCTSAAGQVQFSPRAWSMGVSSMGKEGVEAVFDLFGAKWNWDALGKDDRLKKLLGSKKSRETGEKTQVWLEDIRKKRNAFAHAGTGGPGIDAEYVLSREQFLQRLAEVLAGELAKVVGGFK